MPAPLRDDASDREILRGLLEAKPEAFHRFFESWFPRIHAFALRELRNRPLAEAVTRQTLKRAVGDVRQALEREDPVAEWLLEGLLREIAFARRPTIP